MQWIILIGNENFKKTKKKNIEHFGKNKVADVDSNRFVIDYENGHVFYDYVEDLINDYEEEERLLIPFLKPNFIMMIYSSEELMEEILLKENFPKGIYIDNDLGLMLPIEEFIKLIKDKRKIVRKLLSTFRKK